MSNKRSNLKIDILYEDTNIVAVNKPAGLMVHPDGRAKGPFLTDWVLAHYPKAAKVGEPARTPQGEDIARPGIVHRLDRETSGVLLVAKTKKGFDCLKKQFQERTIQKNYLAYVWGELEEEFGTIDRPIGRSSSDFRKWSSQRGARGELRDAETYWQKVRELKVKCADGTEANVTLVEVEPKTGRTHQIRVHFAAIQHPLVGDTLYAPKRPKVHGIERTALHAKQIEFLDCAGKKVKVEAPLPKELIL